MAPYSSNWLVYINGHESYSIVTVAYKYIFSTVGLGDRVKLIDIIVKET